MKKISIIFLVLNIFLFSYSQSPQVLDQKNGFKHYKLGEDITKYPDAKITTTGFDCGVKGYTGFMGLVQTKESFYSWKKHIKTYIIKSPNTTIFNEPVHAIMFTVVNDKIIRIIVRVKRLNISVPKDLLGKESNHNYDSINKNEKWVWSGSNVELAIFSNVFEQFYKNIDYGNPEYCKNLIGGYDLHYVSKRTASYFDSHFANLKNDAKTDF